MAFRIGKIAPDDPPDTFPDPARAGQALGYPDGLLAIGGDLSPERLLAAYRRGIFPWYNDDQPVLWWSPDPRAVIYPEEFHVSRRLRRDMRRRDWQFSVNRDFPAVIDGCAANRGKFGTWITPDMRSAYLRMHDLGYAHSVESWLDGELAGGIYGIRLGAIFFGESMFSAVTNGSKVAITALLGLAPGAGVRLLDCQLPSPHLASLGMRTLPRGDFLALLPDLTRNAEPLPGWVGDPQTLTALPGDRPATC